MCHEKKKRSKIILVSRVNGGKNWRERRDFFCDRRLEPINRKAVKFIGRLFVVSLRISYYNGGLKRATDSLSSCPSLQRSQISKRSTRSEMRLFIDSLISFPSHTREETIFYDCIKFPGFCKGFCNSFTSKDK